MRGQIVVDCQFGSTGKGLICGVLAKDNKPDTIFSAWAANAGHTFIDESGRKFVHTMLPNGVVSPKLKRIMIGPGSLIDPEALLREKTLCWDYLRRGVDILIHPYAAVITQEHRDLEAGPMTKIGSTKKGVGEAAIQRIRRDPDNMNIACTALTDHPLHGHVVTVDQYNNAVDQARQVLIEGAQGYSLSMYHGFYPYCTSRDVSTAQILADVGIPVSNIRNIGVVGTARVYPIRVANRFDGSGGQVGWSGPCYDDQKELDWGKDLGREAELTTVTKLPRRIFSWSEQQLLAAVRQCSVDALFLNFVNYLPDASKAVGFVNSVQRLLRQETSAQLVFVGMGPTERDVWTLDENDGLAGANGDPFGMLLPMGRSFKEGDTASQSDLARWIRGYYARSET